MREHTSIAMKYARAVADPLRLRIVAALADRPRTVSSLARELNVTEPRIVRRARALQAMGLVQPRAAEGVPQAYELLGTPELEDAEWDQLGLPVKRSITAATLMQIHATAAAAVDVGGFDRPDIRLGRIRAQATEAQWQQMAEVVADTVRRLDEIVESAEADAPPEPRIPATAVLMLFTSEHTESQNEKPPPVPAFGEDEASQQTYHAVEAITAAMVEPTRTWARIEALAEELRLIARAAMNAEDAATQRVAQS